MWDTRCLVSSRRPGRQVSRRCWMELSARPDRRLPAAGARRRRPPRAGILDGWSCPDGPGCGVLAEEPARAVDREGGPFRGGVVRVLRGGPLQTDRDAVWQGVEQRVDACFAVA